MKKYKVQVIMVSGQPTPNMLPMLDKEIRPEKIIMLTSAGMQEKAEQIEAFCARKHIKTERIDIDAYNTDSIEQTILELLENNSEEDIALNITGGTKIMAIIAQEIFRQYDKPVFYINIENDSIIELPNHMQARSTISTFNPRLKINDLLVMHNWEEEIRQKPKPLEGGRAEYVSQLVARITEKNFSLAIGTLNSYATTAKDRKKQEITIDAADSDKKSFTALLQLAMDAGLIEHRSEPFDTIRFCTEEDREFICGGWLEHHIFDEIRKLRGKIGISDEAMNLKVKSSKETSNELDVAFIAQNQLYVIECKTANLKHKDRDIKQTKGTEAIYKLDAIAEKLGGMRTNTMLVSYRKIGDADKKRAAQYNIKLLYPENFHRLGEVLTEWVKKK